jgi:glycolate oxidase FAD binding subunit
MPSTPIVISSAEQACDAVRAAQLVSIQGGGTKPALRVQDETATVLDLRGLSGMIEYEPSEFVFTAKAGTPLKDILPELDRAGQCLPFDPLLIEQGSTLGGCIASGISGPGRFRYGGVRDFVIGVRFVDGMGRLIKGGGKVVKNAAGFDFPKLMVGGLGRFGVLTEVSFKVFPKPEATMCARTVAPSLEEGIRRLIALAGQPFDLDAIELLPTGEVFLRIAGHRTALQTRFDAIAKATGFAFEQVDALPPIAGSVRVPVTPPRIAALDAVIASHGVPRRYSVAGNLAWIDWNKDLAQLHDLLVSQRLSGQSLKAMPCKLGVNPGAGFENIVKRSLDPENKFGPLP